MDEITSTAGREPIDPQNLNERELQLFVELGFQIAFVTWITEGRSDYSQKSALNSMLISCFEGCRFVLEELGIVTKEIVVRKDGRFKGPEAHTYRTDVRIFETRDYLRSIKKPLSFTLDEMVVYAVAALEHLDLISTSRQPFEVREELLVLMLLLCELGMAEHDGKEFVWTNRLTVPMVERGLWSTDGESFNDKWEKSANDATDKLWKALPFWQRQYIARVWMTGKTEMDLHLYLLGRWNGRRFQLSRDYSAKLQSDEMHELTVGLKGVIDRLKLLRYLHWPSKS